MQNLNQFIALIKKYRTMTPQKIVELAGEEITLKTSEKLTGFGTFKTCTLCQSVEQMPVDYYGIIQVEPNCDECVWTHIGGFRCNSKLNCDTYDAISEAETPESLSNAYRARARLMVNRLSNFKLISRQQYEKLIK